jgi:hypothetical protein
MQGRSWMAALALAVGMTSAPLPTRAGDGDDANTAIVNKVALTVGIKGLGREECEVEIKPGHAACDFKPITRKFKYDQENRGYLRLDPIEVRSTSPDRDCQFLITIKEPGQPPRGARRGLRLARPSDTTPTPQQSFVCYLRSPSLIAKEDGETRVK